MRCPPENELVRACRILFGPETAISRDFFVRLQPSGISKAFKKKALAVHPDRLITANEEAKKKGIELFIEAQWARERLILFCKSRDSARQCRSKGAWSPATAAHGHAAHPCRDRRYTDGRIHSDRLYAGVLPQRSLLFGEFLYYSGIISWKTFIEAIVWQRRQRPRFGTIALQWRYLTEREIGTILVARQFSESMGEAALRMGLLSPLQVNTILYYQRLLQRRIGEYFVEHGCLTSERVETLLRKCKRHNARFASRGLTVPSRISD